MCCCVYHPFLVDLYGYNLKNKSNEEAFTWLLERAGAFEMVVSFERVANEVRLENGKQEVEYGGPWKQGRWSQEKRDEVIKVV